MRQPAETSITAPRAISSEPVQSRVALCTRQTVPVGRQIFRARQATFCSGSISKSRASMAKSISVTLAAAAHSKFRGDFARGEARARALPASRERIPAVALASGTPRRRALDLGARRARERTPRPSIRRPRGAESSRCCSVWSGCCPRMSPVGRRHGALGPPGGRVVGHARGIARRGAARSAQRRSPSRFLGLARAARLRGHPRSRGPPPPECGESETRGCAP